MEKISGNFFVDFIWFFVRNYWRNGNGWWHNFDTITYNFFIHNSKECTRNKFDLFFVFGNTCFDCAFQKQYDQYKASLGDYFVGSNLLWNWCLFGYYIGF